MLYLQKLFWSGGVVWFEVDEGGGHLPKRRGEGEDEQEGTPGEVVGL